MSKNVKKREKIRGSTYGNIYGFFGTYSPVYVTQDKTGIDPRQKFFGFKKYNGKLYKMIINYRSDATIKLKIFEHSTDRRLTTKEIYDTFTYVRGLLFYSKFNCPDIDKEEVYQGLNKRVSGLEKGSEKWNKEVTEYLMLSNVEKSFILYTYNIKTDKELRERVYQLCEDRAYGYLSELSIATNFFLDHY